MTGCCRLQLVACGIGILAGLAPSLSFTSPFWELLTSQFGDGPVRVQQVTPGSPAERAGFRSSDAIVEPRRFDDVNAALRSLRPGEKRTFQIERETAIVPLELTGHTPQVAAVWYASPWYPIAGAVALGFGLLVYATSPLQPAPLWRSAIITVGGLGLAIGYALALILQSPFSRFCIFQRWLMGVGDEWTWGQGWWGLGAGLALSWLAATEMRTQLAQRSRRPLDVQAERSAPSG